MITDKCDWVFSVHPFTKPEKKKKERNNNEIDYIDTYLKVNNPIEEIFMRILSTE